jgi:hypothetical protein
MLLFTVVLISLAAVAAMFVAARRRRHRIDLGGVSDRWLMSHRMEL